MWKKYTFIQARSKKNHRKKKKKAKKNYITGTALTELVLEAQTMETCRSSPASTEGGARRAHEHTKTSIEQGKKSNSEVRRGKKSISDSFPAF